MKRDFSNVTRVLDDIHNNDIIYKKAKVKEMFNADPDLKEVLGQLSPLPLNKYADKNNPTEEELKERARILDYNEKVSHDQILSYLKVNDVQSEVLNFVMFDIGDERPSYTSGTTKRQVMTVMCLVQENDMDTEYGVDRVDLLSYIIKDLLCWSNVCGIRWKLYSDTPMVTENTYYMRTLVFEAYVPNGNNFRSGGQRNSNER